MAGTSIKKVVFVEGVSDQAALEALAGRHGRVLESEGVSVVRIGGAHAIGRFLADLEPERRAGLGLAGLCDAGEEGVFRRALERAGLGSGLTRAGMERLGFYTCVDDLEDELIRSLGTRGVEAVLEAESDLASFRMFQQQPAQRGRDPRAQLRRFLGTRSGRKAHYARVLVEALELDRAPRPLAGLLAHALAA